MWNTLKTIFSNLIVTGHLQVLCPRLYEVPYVGIKNSEILWKNILFELDTLYYRPELACHLFPALPTAKHWATKLSQTNWSRNKGEDKRTLNWRYCWTKVEPGVWILKVSAGRTVLVYKGNASRSGVDLWSIGMWSGLAVPRCVNSFTLSLNLVIKQKLVAPNLGVFTPVNLPVRTYFLLNNFTLLVCRQFLRRIETFPLRASSQVAEAEKRRIRMRSTAP